MHVLSMVKHLTEVIRDVNVKIIVAIYAKKVVKQIKYVHGIKAIKHVFTKIRQSEVIL